MIKKGILTVVFAAFAVSGCTTEPASVLIFSKTAGYRHESIEPGIEAFRALGLDRGFTVTTTEDAELFTDVVLREYDAIVFLSTTGDVLNPTQQQAFQRYIQAGGGFLGIHAASDTEYDWPWFGQLVGGYFSGHPGNPNVREGKLLVANSSHPSTAHLPAEWIRMDEWYDIRDQNESVTVLLNIDESTYKRPDENPAPAPRPIAWYNEFDGGRMFYTALGHTDESFTEQDFIKHVWGGLSYVFGNQKRDYASATVVPEEARFNKTVLDQNLNEPMELDFLNDDQIIFVERPGNVKIHTLSNGTTDIIATLPVSTFGEEGLIGIAVDPDYENNNWVYLAYSDPDEWQTNLSRFTLKGKNLDRDSEIRMLTIPVDRGNACCHMGGSIEFDKDGNLFLSAGDNTNPFESDGYDPIDERRGRSHYDAQRSAGNSMDIRGSIIRITPQPDGSYTVPDGNLFSDPEEGRPEIYVMGNRNPFRISIDQHTGFLYWGEVGPDSNADKEDRGPMGYDEINQARSPGFFGWPYFIGDNKPYVDFDFQRSRSNSPFRPASIVNDSPNNTGTNTLPVAQPAFIWYPYGKSASFPNLGTGGRTAMAGPVFYTDDYPKSDVAFPSYFDGKLLIYEWMRNFIATVTMDDEGDLVRIDRFMEATLDVSNPMDMLFGPDGSLYLLEYGRTWNQRNLDARLSRITYNGGNRSPVARITGSERVGAAPLTVRFSGNTSTEPDADPLAWAWDFDNDGNVDSRDETASHTYNTPGVHQASLQVRDEDGATDETTVEIVVGNAPPVVKIESTTNQTFYFDNQTASYAVSVSDAEDGNLTDGTIASDGVVVTFDFVPQGADLIAPAVGHASHAANASTGRGESLIAQSDCLGCHQTKDASNGPAFDQVADRYAGKSDAREYLVRKVTLGGGGIWGDRPMAAHPDLDPVDAGQMVDYILSLADTPSEKTTRLQTHGTLRFNQHTKSSSEGSYILTASYEDTGGEIGFPLRASKQLILRSPRVEAETLTASHGLTTDGGIVKGNGHLLFESADLESIASISVVLGSGTSGNNQSGKISLRIDDVDGREVALIDLSSSAISRGVAKAPLAATSGTHDLYIVLSGFDNSSAGIDRFIVSQE